MNRKALPPPRSMQLVFALGQLRTVPHSPEERAKVVALLARLLLEASGIAKVEDADETA